MNSSRPFLFASVMFAIAFAGLPLAASAQDHDVKIGNYFVDSPFGIAFVVDDAAGFLIDPVWEEKGAKSKWFPNDAAYVPPAVTAPDFSFSRSTFRTAGANIQFTWGRVGSSAVIATLETDKPVTLTLHLPGGTWPHFHSVYNDAGNGVTGSGIASDGRFIPFALRVDTPVAYVRANLTFSAEVALTLIPGTATHFVAAIGELPSFDAIDSTLSAAEKRYTANRVSAEGDWGDFLGATMDNINNVRLYSSDNMRVAHAIGRGWWMGKDPDLIPYFVWDLFFNGMISSLEDPAGAKNTVRAVLGFQNPDGRVPSFSHWTAEGGTYNTVHRSMPPVGALCVWKMNERHPDKPFLEEVYPKLVRWHEWWMKARDGNHNGLLEWGSEQHFWQGAQFETGWDDNVEYMGTKLEGTTMNADAVDLSSLWSMDAEYLERIAAYLGKAADAARFKSEHAAMNKRINDRLWNEEIGIYCSRFWELQPTESAEIDPNSVFKSGFDVTFSPDAGFKSETEKSHTSKLDYDWKEKSTTDTGHPMEAFAKVQTAFTAPATATFRFKLGGGDFRDISMGQKTMHDWVVDPEEQRVIDVACEQGMTYAFSFLYARSSTGPGRLRLQVVQLTPGKRGSDWLTRLTPMNFYPLIAGVPDTARAEKTLSWMYREDKFWLPNLLPTVAKDDPLWPEQEYWHGHIWGPANYLVWQGIKRYADNSHQTEYARRNVNLFMRNWKAKRVSCESYNSTDGTCGVDHPHYSWGTLLNIVGLEALVDVGPNFEPVPRKGSALTENITLRNVPFGGKLYRIKAKGGTVTAKLEDAK